jgi:flagellar hook-basal body complex protein FliE
MSAVVPVSPIAPEILGDLPPISGVPGATLPGVSAPGGFGELFNQGLAQVNASLMASQIDMQRLAAGDVQNLHQVMIRLEESKLSFQLMLQVRNRLLEAYQDVMKMQI